MKNEEISVVKVQLDNDGKILSELETVYTGTEKQCVDYAVSNSLPFLQGFILKKGAMRYKTVIF